MGDDKKKSSGGSKGGTLVKLLVLVGLLLVAAEIASRVTGRGEWSPYVRIMNLIRNPR